MSDKREGELVAIIRVTRAKEKNQYHVDYKYFSGKVSIIAALTAVKGTVEKELWAARKGKR